MALNIPTPLAQSPAAVYYSTAPRVCKGAFSLSAKGKVKKNDINQNYECVTRGIRVSVEPFYLDDQSDPDEPRYVWAYTVRIDNESNEPVQLRTRYWQITDAKGLTDEVRGDGVVGEQPVIRPGEGFEYTSGAPLPTPSGLMVGRYGMTKTNGESFDVNIPAFSLDSPYELRQIH